MIVVSVMVVPGIILGRDWQMVAMPVILLQGSCGQGPVSDCTARDHGGRDQSVIVLPGIMRAGTSQ